MIHHMYFIAAQISIQMMNMNIQGYICIESYYSSMWFHIRILNMK